VGFLGLGNMGVPIAANLLAAHPNLTLRVWNRTSSKVAAFREQLLPDHAARVVACETPGDAVPPDGGIVLSIVSNDAALDALVAALGPALRSGVLHAVFSTVSPATTDRLTAHHMALGATYVACPVFGRPEAAAARKLIAVPAGPAEATDRLRPLLAATAQKVVWAGPNPSSASVLKLCGNFMILTTVEMCAEAFALAEAHSVDRSVAYDLLAGPTGVLASLPIIPNYGRMVATNSYTPVGFTATNGLKDATLIAAAAEAGRVPMPIADLVKRRLETVVSRPGGGDRDWASFAADVHPTPPDSCP
jgi:3-hydroxyisobutyrate dehydrogenase-like beta-hydroxyacid dehydrogenase